MSSNVVRPDLTFSFTRPADTLAYAAGDQVGSSTTPGAGTPISFNAATANGRGCIIRNAWMVKSGPSITLADFRLYLFNAPITDFGDNNGYHSAITYTDVRKAIGFFNFNSAGGQYSFGVGGVLFGSFPNGIVQQTHLGVGTLLDGRIYGALVALSAYVPLSAEQFQIRLAVEQD